MTFIESNLPVTCFLKTGNPELNNLTSYTVSDFNGDGKSDILEMFPVYVNNNFKGITTNLMNNTSTDFFPETQTGLQIISFRWSFNPYLDFNGDGNSDIFIYDWGPTGRTILFGHFNENSNRVLSITNGNNLKTSIDYAPLTDNAVYDFTDNKNITNTVNLSDGLILFQKPIFVVKQLNSPDGIGGIHSILYHYGYALLHKKGKGFLGFIETSITDANINTTQAKTFSFYSGFYDLFVESFYVKQGEQTISSSSINCQYIVTNGNLQGNRSYFIPQSDLQTYNYLQSTSSYSTNLTDIYGNILNTNSDFYAEGALQGSITQVNEYTTAGSWCPSKLSKTTVTKTRNGQTPYTRISQFEYNTEGSTTKIIADPGMPEAITTEYLQFDAFGNAGQVKLSAQGEPDRNTYTQFDSKGRFVIQQTDIAGYISQSTYDEETGNITTSTDINGFTTRYDYNSLGQLTSSYFPDETSIHQSTQRTSDFGAKYSKIIEASGNSPTTSYFDELGREIATKSKGFNGEDIISHKKFNNKGQVYKVYEPHFIDIVGNNTTIEYDALGRISKKITPIGNFLYIYDGRKTSIQMPDMKTVSSSVNAFGETETSTDADGNSVSYSYNSAGMQISVSAPGGTVVTSEYDLFGNRTKITDPDAGTVTNTYDVFGNVKTQTDNKGNTYQMNYDFLGRLSQKSGPNGMVNYTYDTQKGSLSMLKSVTKGNSTVTMNYDGFGRLRNSVETFEGTEYVNSFEYDNLGRQSKITYPSGFAFTNQYNENGYLTEIRRADNNQMITKTLSVNALGQPLQIQSGNGLITTYDYDNSNRPENVQTGTIFNYDYSFNSATGNMTYREDNKKNLRDDFAYDNLNRLTGFWAHNQKTIVNTSYDAGGNIMNKSDAGEYRYDNHRIHAVDSIKNAQSSIPSFLQDISYTAFNKVSTISENNKRLELFYGFDEQRRKSVLYENNNIVKTKLFFGNYEKTTTAAGTVEYNYLPGNAVYILENGNGNMYWQNKDHLGSVISMSNQAGVIVANTEQSFDAWGRRRNPVDWSYNNIPTISYLLNDRGYTGHEHLTQFGIINMNGRLYDPVLGRMLSPDPFVQAPGNSQNYNRYSYVLNNPLKYTDPSGRFWNLVVGAVIGGFMGYMQGSMAGATGWRMVGYIGVGAVAGALSAGVGSGMSSVLGGGTFGAGFVGSSSAAVATSSFYTGSIIGASSGFTGGLVNGFGTSMVNGQSFGSSSKTGITQGLIGAGTGYVLGGIGGGINAEMDDRNFWHGGRVIRDNRLKSTYSITLQKNEKTCWAATGEMTASYENSSITQENLINMYGDKPLNEKELTTMISDNFTYQPVQTDAVSIEKAIIADDPLYINYNVDKMNRHAVLGYRMKTYDNGRFVLYASDPNGGTYRFTQSDINQNNFRQIFQITGLRHPIPQNPFPSIFGF